MSDETSKGGRPPLSAAKEYTGTHGTKTLDDASRKVREQFDRARNGEVSPSQGAETRQREPLSVAREATGTHGTKAMDDASKKLREQFDRARSGAGASPAKNEITAASPAPTGPDAYRMKGPIGSAVDRDALEARRAADAKQLKELNDSLRTRHEAENAVRSKNGREKDHDDRGR